MPVWAQIIIGASALIIALGVLWTKIIRPTAKMITLAEKLVPLLSKLAEVFKDDTNALNVLKEIAGQFRTDSGSSLRDVVNRIDGAADVLKLAVEAAKQLAERDREQLHRMEIFLDRLGQKVEASSATGLRVEQQALGVAVNLEASHDRANLVTSGEPGAAADAAAQVKVEN